MLCVCVHRVSLWPWHHSYRSRCGRRNRSDWFSSSAHLEAAHGYSWPQRVRQVWEREDECQMGRGTFLWFTLHFISNLLFSHDACSHFSGLEKAVKVVFIKIASTWNEYVIFVNIFLFSSRTVQLVVMGCLASLCGVWPLWHQGRSLLPIAGRC